MCQMKRDVLEHEANASEQAQRNPEEEGDYMAFEQLVAEAAAKKENKKKGKDKKDHHHHAHHAEAQATADDAPNVPKA
jgi:hypothetical protein